jgi:two-component system, chemotaxis family, chemotaxis protein CheY
VGDFTGDAYKNGNMRQRYKTNILIVDDSATMRKIVSRSLREAGLAVGDIYEAGNGIEALAVLAVNKEEIQLILSDVNMPEMDGVDFVKAARSKGIKTPIVMITTETEDVLNQAFANGALTSIKKPFTAEQLNQKLGGLF